MGFKKNNHFLVSIISKNWGKLIIGGLVGSLIAFFISLLFFHPIYTAQSEISIVINFKEVGHLTQYEQDQVIGNVMSLFSSSEVVDETIANIKDEPPTTTEFRKNCFLERQVNSIFFRCQSTNPNLAVNWANQWGQISQKSLEVAYTHAIKYEELMRKQQSYENCVEKSVFTLPTFMDCSALFSDQKQFEELHQTLDQEFKFGKNIYPGIKFSEIIPARIPTRAIRNQTNLLVLSGAFFGFFLTIGLLLQKEHEK